MFYMEQVQETKAADSYCRGLVSDYLQASVNSEDLNKRKEQLSDIAEEAAEQIRRKRGWGRY